MPRCCLAVLHQLEWKKSSKISKMSKEQYVNGMYDALVLHVSDWHYCCHRFTIWRRLKEDEFLRSITCLSKIFFSIGFLRSWYIELVNHYLISHYYYNLCCIGLLCFLFYLWLWSIQSIFILQWMHNYDTTYKLSHLNISATIAVVKIHLSIPKTITNNLKLVQNTSKFKQKCKWYVNSMC